MKKKKAKAKRIRDTFWTKVTKCACGHKFGASTMDISAGSPIFCPKCGVEFD